MAELPKRRLKAVESYLRSVAGSSELKNRDIDWRLINNQLRRLETAIRQADITVFEEAFAMIKTRLSPANVLRGNMTAKSESKSPLMPPQILELLNHIVDTLHFENTQSAAKAQKNEPNKIRTNGTSTVKN